MKLTRAHLQSLTRRQSEVFRFIIEFLKANQCTPTVREIGKAFGIGSPNGVVCHLKALEKKGLIRRVPGEARNIRLLNVNITVEDRWAT